MAIPKKLSANSKFYINHSIKKANRSLQYLCKFEGHCLKLAVDPQGPPN